MKIEFPVLNNNKLHYFDYGATTFMPKNVIDKWCEINSNVGVFIGRGSSILTKKAEKELKNNEDYLKNFFGISDEYQNVYAKNVTEAINIVALSIQDTIKPLDIIVVGPFEHHSNYLIWRKIAKKRSALFFEMPLNKDGSVDYNFLDRYKERIKVVSISAVSNAFGYKLSIEKIANKIEKDTILFVDESQVVAHSPLEINEKITGYFIPSHKMYGPKNISIASIKKTLIDKMNPVILGGGMVKSVGYNIEWLEDNKKFYAGTMDIGLMSAWVEACKFIKNISYDEIAKKNENYSQTIKKVLKENGYKLVKVEDNCANYIISFTHPKIHAHDINEYLSSKSIIIRSGNLCSQNSLRKIESNALNRITLGVGITDDDVKCLCEELTFMAKNSILNQYSKMIYELLNFEENIILIPDLILDKEGIACGDKIVISGEIDDDIILFKFDFSMACDLSKAVCNYLMKEYNRKDYYQAMNSLSSLKEQIDKDNEIIFKIFNLDYEKYQHRFECIYDPIKLLINFLIEIKKTKYIFTEKPDTHYNMACDACTSACRINWNNEKVEKENEETINTNVFPKVYTERWLPMGKIVLNENNKKNLKMICKNMTQIDYKFLFKNKINSIVLQHIIENCPNELNENWKVAAYLIQKNEITSKQFEIIKDYISSSKLNVYSIKGYVTQKYYKNNYMRTHSDYDLIAKSSKDAFELITYLLKNGFTIRPNVFSIKNMYYDGKEVVTGHFHLQKILDDMYMFELDISFPGFPINRVDIFYPTFKNNEISTEDQIIITLLHLFKHSDVYMKDINDLFYMLNTDIDYIYLKEKIDKYKINEFLSMVVMYILREYPVDLTKFNKLIDVLNIDEQILNKYSSWPYDSEEHLQIKKKDFEKRVIEKDEDDRKYLFPAVVFIEKFDFKNIYHLKDEDEFLIKPILDDIYEISYNDYKFYLTSIGIFIDNYINTEKISRKGCLEILEKFLNIIDKKDFYTVSYATKHFNVRTI